MVYVKFIHPDLLKDPDYKKWCQKPIPREAEDWKDLYDWLGEHTRIAYRDDEILREADSKCWYSEAPVLGKHGKDVEHFRPKSNAKNLRKDQSRDFRRAAGYLLPEGNVLPGGYHWLSHDALNYRLAHPHSNRNGSKGDVFPILKDTSRLSCHISPDSFREHYLLLDPASKEDAETLWVQPDGQIVPRYNKGIFPSGILRVQKAPETYQYLRAQASIIVYELNHPDLVKGRRRAYNEAKEHIEAMLDKHPRALVREAELLRRKLACASPFSLAARCAFKDQVVIIQPDSPKKQAVIKLLEAIWQDIQQREN